MSKSEHSVPPTERFSDRVAYYLKYRPRYPEAILPFLRQNIQLTAASVVADIGSGTGFLTELFLANGNDVYAVEPNAEMRAAAEALHGKTERFHSVSGHAENTTLAANSVDIVTAGQAFHWFEVHETRKEFQRILRPVGWVVLVYNSWNLPNSTVARDYRRLVDAYGTDYRRVSCQNAIGDNMKSLFGARGYQEARFANDQSYNFEELRGRALSSSYAPLPGHANYEPLLAGLGELFEQHAIDGRLLFPYETTVYWGKLDD